MKHTALLFKQSLKSSDLQISPSNDQLYIFCIKYIQLLRKRQLIIQLQRAGNQAPQQTA